jgi:hypothetical protein
VTSPRKLEEAPPELLRREIFMALVEAQDQCLGVRKSRKVVAERFGISVGVLKEIEEEGLDHEWPPL